MPAKVPKKDARKAAAKPKKAAKKTPRKPAKAAKKAFGRPGTAGKAEGDAAVKAWMAGVEPAHRPLVQRLDALIGETVPGVKRAIKWSSPMYGLPGRGWFASLAAFKNHVGLAFFAGTRLDPVPPLGEGKGMRRVNLTGLSDLDEEQVRSWVRQASSIQGWGTVK
ncbi:MAG TPA: DUF1801 domain-containing protein [Candidatus Thermoplasmatota archaeon]|nr:DUF1801 domain-containing protein [Candidatus Thermoplasmatota archaeon]